MANESYYNIVNNEETNKIISENKLPHGDEAQFISGNLSNSIITTETLKDLNNKLKYKTTQYQNNELLVDSNPTQEGNHVEAIPIELLENGFYYLQLASAGGRGQDSPVYYGTYYKTENDYVTFNKQNAGLNTWERERKDNDGYIEIWRGSYSYLNNTIFLRLAEYGIQDPFGIYTKVETVSEQDDYGIFMIKEDYVDHKIKLFAFRNDDADEELYAKYEDGYIDVNSKKFIPDQYSTLTLNYDTIDYKGGDGALYNEVCQINAGVIRYGVGRKALSSNSSGGKSFIAANIILNLEGGGTDSISDFGGMGGSFVYDYYKRIIYDDTIPEDGYFKLRYLGNLEYLNYTITVIKDEEIDKISIPENNTPAGFMVTVKTLIHDEKYEIDYDASTINGILFKDFTYLIYHDSSSSPVREGITLSEYNYYGVQIITFPMPNENVSVDLKVKKVKFTIKIDKDEFIESFTIENASIREDGTIEAESNTKIHLNIKYINGDYLINDDVLIYYLCVDPTKSDTIEIGQKNPFNYQDIYFTMPARNVIVKLKCDYLFVLTLQINERQVIEENEKNSENPTYKQRGIESIILREFEKGEQLITNFPYVRKVKYQRIFDLYIKYSDIYMCVDTTHLYSQLPTLVIEQMGDFRQNLIPPQILPNDIHFPYDNGFSYTVQTTVADINDINNGYKKTPNYEYTKDHEYYQHIRLYMPSSSQVLDFKWKERQSTIYLNYKDEFIEAINITDTTKIVNKNNPEGRTELNQTIFPHKTYPIVENTLMTNFNNIIYNNSVVKLNLLLKPHFKIKIPDDNSSFSIIDKLPVAISEYSSGMKPAAPNSLLDARISPNINIRYDIELRIPKKDLFVNLNIYIDYLHINHNNYSQGSVLLDAGTYEITIIGAGGGSGGQVQTDRETSFEYGRNGGKCILQIEFRKPTNVYYGIGQGGHGGGNNTGKRGSSAGGGGGGGASLVYWDAAYEDFTINSRQDNNGTVQTWGFAQQSGAYCSGGSGGRGGMARSGNGGGSGGAGGFVPRGHGRMGYMGGWSWQIDSKGDSWLGFATPGAPGGMGWGTNDLIDKGYKYFTINQQNTRHGMMYYESGPDGQLIIDKRF